jgi:hypothetical protein
LLIFESVSKIANFGYCQRRWHNIIIPFRSKKMADRKQFMGVFEPGEGLLSALRRDSEREISEEELAEQRISFAYGNAGRDSRITKESVSQAASRSRLMA